MEIVTVCRVFSSQCQELLKIDTDPSEGFPPVVRCHVSDEGYIVSLLGRMESWYTMLSVCLFVVVSQTG
jgi:hypothetical protein